MPKFLARAVTFILHPVFMPLIGTIIIFHSGTTISIMDKNVMRLIYLFTAFATCLLPLSLIPLLIQLKVIQSIEMTHPRERVIPYFLTFLLYYAAHLMISRLHVNYYFSVYLFSASVLVLVLLIISFFWKISSHMAGIGGLCGLILSISFELKADLMYMFIFFILASGILGTARLKLNSHSQSQVFAGFLTGIVVVYGIIHLLYAYRT